MRAMVSGAEMFTPAVADRLFRANGDIQALRTYSSYLQEEDWEQIDSTVRTITKSRLTVVDDMRNMGLVNPINNLGVLLSKWYTQSDIGEATQSMDGRVRGDKSKIVYDVNYLPIPITHADFQINWRDALARQNGSGAPLDTTTIALSARRVAEKLEHVFLNGSDITVNGNDIPGFLNHTKVMTGSVTDGWETSATRDIVQDIVDMKQDLVDAGFPEMGPYNVYVSSLYSQYLDIDLNDYKDKTYRKRIMEITGINDVKTASKIPHSNQSGEDKDYVLMVYMGRENIVIDQAADIQTVEWGGEGGFVKDYKVFSAMTLRMMPDMDDTLGVVVYSDSPDT